MDNKDYIRDLFKKTLEKYIISEEIKQKNPIGKGRDHIVYDYHADPSKVIKIAWDNPKTSRPMAWDGNGNVVSKDYTKLDPKHIEMFIEHPNLFPKVFKFTDKYAIIEKLDIKKTEQEENKLANQLKPYINGDEIYDSVSFKIYIMLTDKWSLKRGEYVNLIKKMYEAGEDLTLLFKYVRFFKQIIDEIGVLNNKPRFVDVRKENLGYDKKNNLKLLDF
jgi:hypothetical protein